MEVNKQYDDTFYKDIINGSRASATVVVPQILSLFSHVRSVVDLGCGAGTWLKEFELAGREIAGYDFGVGVPKNLVIPADNFTPADLSSPIVMKKKFDLAISLEVAEHIPPNKADIFVNSLTSAADIIVFSAAIPCQGGTDHCNEQWISYWAAKFDDKGFQCFDCLRPSLWHDSRIAFWYRQNLVLLIKKELSSQYPQITQARSFYNYPLVHPDAYFAIYNNNSYIHNKIKEYDNRPIFPEQELCKVYRSRSWRITAPLRLLGCFMRSALKK